MNIGQLKQKIKDLPDHLDIFISQKNDEFSLSMVQEAKVVKASFMEDTGPILAKDNVFFLTDEID